MAQTASEVRIFLCHASEDKEKVVEVYHTLKAAGYNPWLDKEDLLPGQIWDEEIPKAIKASSFILIFFSMTSVAKRGYVQKEFKLVLDTLDEIPEGQIFVIPVRLDNCQIPYRFSRIHYVDLFEQGGFGKVIKSLRSAMGRLGIIDSLQMQSLPSTPGIIKPLLSLRSDPINSLSKSQVRAILVKYDFYCGNWFADSKEWYNPQGKGIEHNYEKSADEKVVIDKVTSLTWQQSGSPEYDNFEDAQQYIVKLNKQKFAGFSDWRLPTLEEAMSLMERERKGGLHINQVFDKAQRGIWTADHEEVSRAWIVTFFQGSCMFHPRGSRYPYSVRAVRSGY